MIYQTLDRDVFDMCRSIYPGVFIKCSGVFHFYFCCSILSIVKENTLFKVMHEEAKKMDITAEFKDLVAQYSSVTAEEMTDETS